MSLKYGTIIVVNMQAPGRSPTGDGSAATWTTVAGTIVKRVLLGRAISTHAELHHRLNKRLGLAVFSSDALSSSAYATDEIFLVLMLAGAGALYFSVPIALAVAFVLSVVIASYRQTVKAYPRGGGAYLVAKENLGEWSGLIAASSLLIDYVLTVSVSVAAGIAAFGAALPYLRDNRVVASLIVVVFITLANLRGLKESGTLFSIPTYGFLVAMGAMIVIGAFKVFTGTHEPFPAHAFEAEKALTLFLILRAFSSGSTALTGVEAISDGVPAFEPPESKNAAQTLLTLGILLSFLFLGITFLARAYNVDPLGIELGRTIPSQIAEGIFGNGSPPFYVVQFFTGMILFLAANTSYADFPRLSSILARDRFLPRVLQNRGDKLAFSNGIVLLAVGAAAVLINAKADVHRIIPLYVVGVFTSFTLSQTGMVRRALRMRFTHWKRSVVISGFGGVTTGVVLFIVALTKFKDPDVSWIRFYTRPGAWLVIALIPALAAVLFRVGRHYSRVAAELRRDRTVPRIERNKVVVLVSPLLGATLKALSFARAMSPAELHVVAFRVAERRLQEIRRRWRDLGIDIPIEATGYTIDDFVDYIRGLDPTESQPVTVVIPDPQTKSRIRQLLRGRLLLRIKGALLDQDGVVVISVPFRPDIEAIPERLRAPTRLVAIVLVAAVHRATLAALEYAKSIHPSELKALMIATDTQAAMELMLEWQSWNIDMPIELIDSPYRSIVDPLINEIERLHPNPTDAVAVVIPEFLVPRWWQHLLHGQTALLLKTSLLFRPNVFVIDVPYQIRGKGNVERPAKEVAELIKPGG